MIANLAADLGAFFKDFNATAATVGGASVTGIFDAAYDDAMGIGGSGPVFRCASSAVVSAVAGTAVVINSANYTIAGPIENDGTGMAVLRLRDA
jgi:hypothetical protein